MRLRLVVLMIVLTAAASASAPSAGATTIVDFEAPSIADNTEITNQYAASKGVTFVSGAPTGAFGLPRMRLASAEAHGGQRSLNISTDAQEFPHPDFAGAFSTTRSTVTLYARAAEVNVASLTLNAYNSAGTVVATTSHPLPTAAGWVSFTVATAGDDPTIAYFRLSSTSSGPVRVDDLSFDDPVSPPPADFALQTAEPRIRTSAGATVSTTLTINRINGSDGAILLSDTSSTIDATFSPNPVPATATSVTATFTTPASPADLHDTVVATPQVAGAGTAARSLELVLAADFPVIVRAHGDTLTLPPCSSASTSLSITRGYQMTAPVQMTANSVPDGVTATFAPSTLTTETSTTLTFTRGDDTNAPSTRRPQVSGQADGFSLGGNDLVSIAMDPTTLTGATSRAGAWTGAAPATLAPGDTVTVSGTGFCPGSRLRFGNTGAETPVTVTEGGTRAITTVPPLATSGPLTLISPGGRETVSAVPFKVTNYRHSNGFNFPNIAYDGDLSNWIDLYGLEQFFLQADPCALLTFGNAHCPVPTPIPNPLSYIVFAVADPILVSGGGSCFGFALASRRIAAGRGPTPRSFGGATDVFSIPDGPAIKHYIWSQHVAQISSEYLAQYFQQSGGGALSLRSAGGLRSRIESAIRSGARPLISLAQGSTGHAVNGYDVTNVRPDGAFTIRLYNSNAPFTDAEQGVDGVAAADAERHSVINVAADGTWTFPELDWHGGLADIIVLDDRTFPDRPRLPSSPEGIITMIFGAGAPAATAASAATGSQRLVRVPILDDPTPAPVLVGDDDAAHDLGVTPGAGGKVDTLFAGGGRSARVTGAGLNGAAKLEVGPAAKSLGADFARATDLTLTLASRPSAGITRSVRAAFDGTLTGGEMVALNGGAYAITHGGGRGTLRLTLSSAGAGSAPAVFESTPIRVSGASRITVRPDWAHPDRPLKVLVRSGSRVKTVRVTNRARASAPVSHVRVKATRKGRDLTVTVTARVGGKATAAVGAVGVAVRRSGGGAKAIVRKGVAARGTALRRTVIKLRLPANAVKGTLKIQAAVTTVGSGAVLSAPSTARGSRTLR
jgi:hypothetical protein